MFYRDTRKDFKLPNGSPTGIAGGIIAASGLQAPRLIRRPFKPHAYLLHRLFDPQLYLAHLSKDTYSSLVGRLSTYPWFVGGEVPEYSTKQHGKFADWEKQHASKLIDHWLGGAATDPGIIAEHVRKAISIQVRLECEFIILPAPMTRIASQGLATEMRWLDIGLSVFNSMDLPLPVFATVAVTQDLLAGADPETSPFLATLADQISARPIDGVYFVVEQTVDNGYSLRDENTLSAILLFIDDIVRVARRRVIVNHLGPFGAICTAAGAEIWASDYYLSRRRLRLSDLADSTGGSQMPRYFSPYTIGDIGVQSDMDAVRAAGLLPKVLFTSQAAQELHSVLEAKQPAARVYEWQYEKTRTTAAKAHYLEAAFRIGNKLGNSAPQERIIFVRDWLQRAVNLAERLKRAGIGDSYVTELGHQASWLRAYDRFLKRRQENASSF